MIKVYPYLTFAGALPFIFCAICLTSDLNVIPVLGDIKKILSLYGLVIASFIAGAHWGQHLYINDGQWCRLLAIISNIMAVLLWLGFLLLSFKMLLAVLVAAFIIYLIIDYRLFQNNFITFNYFQTRIIVTCIVITSLIFSGTAS